MRKWNRLCLAVAMAFVAATAALAGPGKEMRGVWLSASLAAKDGETPEQTAQRLEDHGFNAVFVSYQPNSEPLRSLLSACRRHHVETHLWVFRPPVEMKDSWRCLSYDEGKGAMVPGHACFCDEEYLAACEEKVRQIVREYDVDGVQFDEVGFSRPWQSLCERCRQKFAADTHTAVSDWPNDVIRVGQVTKANTLDYAAWRGPGFDAFIQWRCGRLTEYLRRLRDAARSVRPVTVSYAAMPELPADRTFYGEDLAELGKVFDFIVPMSYYTEYAGMSGGRPEWTAETCKSLAAWVHQGNPDCRVYAGISAYGSDGGWREPIRDLFQKQVAAGAITLDQQKEHMKYFTCKQGLESLEWLHAEGKLSTEDYERVKGVVDRRVPTSHEIVQAIQSVRKAGLPGFVFFRYECMFEDREQGVIGQDLWPRLKEVFGAPAAPPAGQSAPAK